MPRRRDVPKRRITPDAKYGDRLIAKFTNVLMYGGKKSVAERILYAALQRIASGIEDDALKLFKKALDNVKPMIEVKGRRVGGTTYQVPVEVRPERRVVLAMRWIITSARNRNEATMAERLAAELSDASQNRGVAVKKREDTHRMADANKAFAHFKW